MEPPAPILTSIAVTGPWDLRRSPSLQESGDDGRSRVTRPGEAHCALNTGGCNAHSMHYTLHMAYLTTQCEVQAVKKIHFAYCTVHTTPQYAQHVFSMSKITFLLVLLPIGPFLGRFIKIPHTSNTQPSRTCVIQDYRFYTMSLIQYHGCC